MRSPILWIVVVGGCAVAACGRIDFDPSAGATPATDGKLGDGGGSGSGILDAPVSACATATPVMANVMLQVNTCTSADRLMGCGPAGTKEIILEFVPPANNGYTARAYDHGTLNVTMVSIARLDTTCTAKQSNCAAILGTSYLQGVPAYFILEASNGGCADVDFLIN